MYGLARFMVSRYDGKHALIVLFSPSEEEPRPILRIKSIE